MKNSTFKPCTHTERNLYREHAASVVREERKNAQEFFSCSKTFTKQIATVVYAANTIKRHREENSHWFCKLIRYYLCS